MGLNPSVLLDKSSTHTFRARTGSIGVEFIEVGAGWGKMSGRTGYVPWALMVGGVSLSAVPLQASYHGATSWSLRTGNITLAEAFITFQGSIAYGFLCSSAPLKFDRNYQMLLAGLSALKSRYSKARQAHTWLKSKENVNSLELRLEAAMCGGRVAHQDLLFRDGFSWSTPQAAIGLTGIQFVGTQPLGGLLRTGRTIGNIGSAIGGLFD